MKPSTGVGGFCFVRDLSDFVLWKKCHRRESKTLLGIHLGTLWPAARVNNDVA
jgi:hypothetical protein